MTPDDIHSFIQRLMRRELREGELSALTTRDLGDINAYLAQYAARYANPDASADAAASTGVLTPVRPRPTTLHPKRTYSEREILLEFGVLE